MKVENSSTNNATNVFRCSKCGMPINDECDFCTNCGTKIFQNRESDEIIATSQSVNKCHNCNNEVSEGSMFCVNCGTKLNN